MNCTLRLLVLLLFPFTLNSTTLKIASYNVENLFDMKNNGVEYEEYLPNKHNWTRQNFEKKLLNIAEIICDIDADIIALQEIENKNVLKLLKRRLRTIGCYYKYDAITHKKHSAIQLATLSKIPISSVKEINVNKALKYRPILETKFLIDSKPFYVFNNHWASKHSSESSRVLSAKRLKKRVLSLPKSSEYILLGDFNSDYNEYQHFSRKLNNTQGLVGINHILKTSNNQKLFKKQEISKLSFAHYNLWLDVPTFQRWSHDFYGKKQALDSMLLPSSLFDGKSLDYVNHSFKVFKPAYLFHKKGYVYRWQYKYGRHLGKGYSDHLPIVASFSTKAYHQEKLSVNVKIGTISDLYQNPKSSIMLKKVSVILKTKHHAIIKQHSKGRAIFIYGAESLIQGHCYDLLVTRLKSHKGLREIINFSLEYDYGKKEITSLYYRGDLDFNNNKLQNEVIEHIEGVYKDNKLYIDNKSYPIYFKNKSLKPKHKTYINLKKVQIGMYNRLQLVVW